MPYTYSTTYCSSQEVNNYEMPLKCKAGNAKVMYFVTEHNSKLLGVGVSDIYYLHRDVQMKNL